MAALRILVCASEVVPFAKTGGLADVAGALPQALAALGHDARICLPYYREVRESGAKVRLLVKDLPVPLGGKTVLVDLLHSDDIAGVPTYFIRSDAYFDRNSLYGQPDDPQRFTLFCRAVLEFLRQDAWSPEVIHCNDWQTGLIPTYLKTIYADDPKLGKIGTLFTIHNLAYQGLCDVSALDDAGLGRDLFAMEKLEFYGQVNLLKAGLVFADTVSTVSETYSREILTPEYGERLEGVLKCRADRLFGIINGLDYQVWDPEHDTHLDLPFSLDSSQNKAACVTALRRRVGLPDSDAPLVGLVSRLSAQKGWDLLEEALPALVERGLQFVILGTGEQRYHDLLQRLAECHPENVAIALAFDNTLAHRIYGGSDIFLMPSYYEPCGLGQMIALRYGSVPVVRATGGLADTIQEFDPATGKGNGFVFSEYSGAALVAAMDRAAAVHADAKKWTRLMKNGMRAEFSWEKSARKYATAYRKAISFARAK
jgi:starch synthase